MCDRQVVPLERRAKLATWREDVAERENGRPDAVANDARLKQLALRPRRPTPSSARTAAWRSVAPSAIGRAFEALVIAATRVGPTSLAVVLLASDAGLRLGEIIALRPKDLDLRGRVIHVNTTVWHEQRTLTKGGEPRSLPMSNRLVAAVQGLDLTRPDVINRHSAHGRGQCTPDAIANLIKRAARLAGLGHVHAHLLRHTFRERGPKSRIPS